MKGHCSICGYVMKKIPFQANCPAYGAAMISG